MQLLLRSTRFAGTLFFRIPRFTFVDLGPLRDGELELIAPHRRWLDRVMQSVAHPATANSDPALAATTRQQMSDFLIAYPRGHQAEGSGPANVPAYHFWMLNRARPDLPIAGAITLRVGHGRDLDLYLGHVGYHVYPAHRGNHFAERATRLLLPLARNHGVNPLWITCNPDNLASRKTCERLGATYVEMVAVPPNHPMLPRGEVAKCRYRMDDVPHVHSRWPS